jgi:hypothetical protein
MFLVTVGQMFRYYNVRTIETNDEILEKGGKVLSAECLSFLSNIYDTENWVKAPQSEPEPSGVETHCHTITCMQVKAAAAAAAAAACVCVCVCVNIHTVFKSVETATTQLLPELPARCQS